MNSIEKCRKVLKPIEIVGTAIGIAEGIVIGIVHRNSYRNNNRKNIGILPFYALAQTGRT